MKKGNRIGKKPGVACITLVAMLTLLILCIGCRSNVEKATDLAHHQSPDAFSEKLKKQKFLFERSFTNFAWGYQHRGIYVDNQGNVYRFAYQEGDKPWSPKQPEAITEQELEEKYSHGRKLLRTVAMKELLENYRLIEQARQGSYSKRAQQGADQGGWSSSCFVYDETTGYYKKIELRVSGDWNYENLAPAAKKLADWLESPTTPAK